MGLHAALGLLLDQFLLDGEVARLGHELALGEVFEALLALADQRNRGVELGHGGLDGHVVRHTPVELGVEVGELPGVLVEAGIEQGALGLDQGWIGAGRGRESLARRLGAGELGAEPGDLDPHGHELACQTLAVGGGLCRVELDQQVAGPDRLALLHMDGADHGDLEGLDDLDPAAGNDLAAGGGDDVDHAEPGPDHGDGEERGDHRHDDAAGGRGRGFGDLEGSGQELEFVAPPSGARRDAARWRRCIRQRPCGLACQTAFNIDPRSACKIDPPERHGGGCPGSQ